MFKILMKSIREYKKASILTPIFVTFEVVMECFIPLIMAELINNMETYEVVKMVWLIIALVFIATFGLIFGFLSGKYAAIASSGFAKNLRADMFYRIQDYSFENIDRFSASSLVTRLTTDISNVQMAYGMIIRIAVRSPLMLVFSIVMSFVINVQMAWYVLAFVPIIVIAFFIIFKLAMPIFEKVFKKYDAFNQSVQENIKGIRVVKTYVREKFEQEKFDKASDNLRHDFVKAERIVAFNTPVMQFAMFGAMIVICVVGAYLSIVPVQGKIPSMDAGSLQALLTYGIQILNSLMMLTMIFVMLTMSLAAAKRITEVIKEKSTLTNPKDPIFEVKNGEIEFRDVSFKYSCEAQKNALSNVSIKIPSGSTVGIIGGTGSSKTTLVNLISRLYDVTEGSLLVGGVDVKNYDLKTLRDNVAVVLQKNVLFSGTIKENLRWGKEDATDEEMIHVCHLACADEFVEKFPDGYNTFIEQGGTNVSGGQKQRLCIARALLKSPKILILDDSTSAVDTKTDAIIRQGFKNELPDTTKIIIAQRVASIEASDMIIVLDNGMINAVGTHEELIKTNAIYQEVYNIQNKGGEK